MYAKITYSPLQFKLPAGTSRGILTTKHTWILTIEEDGVIGTGECSVIPNLSPDFSSISQYEKALKSCCNQVNLGALTPENCHSLLADKPSILFGIESAFLDLQHGGRKIYFDNNFSRGKRAIPINGLVWMGDEAFMQDQIETKLAQGFSTIKMKIGAIDFATEFTLLSNIRKRYDASKITLRVDANGAFDKTTAMDVLNELATLDIHSIEQPIATNQWDVMRDLCNRNIVPIALDEELIGVNELARKEALLNTIQPQYIILKPSLHGGISGTQSWIQLAEKKNIKWWITSALESNIGLKTIADLAGEYACELPQGLGTGSLYVANFTSDLKVENGELFVAR